MCDGRDSGQPGRSSGSADRQLRLAWTGMDSVLRTADSETAGSAGIDTVRKLRGNAEGSRILLCKSILQQRKSGGENQVESERRRGQRTSEVVFHIGRFRDSESGSGRIGKQEDFSEDYKYNYLDMFQTFGSCSRPLVCESVSDKMAPITWRKLGCSMNYFFIKLNVLNLKNFEQS